jgi:AraC-like DNA-binding protein
MKFPEFFCNIKLVQFTDYDIECIQKAKSIIDTDLKSHYNIPLIAMKVNMGMTKLKTGFKLYYRIGLYAYLKKQRMIKAAELIVNTNKTIKQIAYDTGFKHSNNFIKAFVSFHGLTPKRYREYFSAE